MLRCNWQAVQVFVRCKMRYAVGAAGAACTGIPAGEIHAALLMRGEPQESWPGLFDDVQMMGNAAAQAINGRIKRESGRQ